jgi:hypothetical protein
MAPDVRNGSSESRAFVRQPSLGNSPGHSILLPSSDFERTKTSLDNSEEEQNRVPKVLDTWFFGRSSCLASLVEAFSWRRQSKMPRDDRDSWTPSTLAAIPKQDAEFHRPPISVASAIFTLFTRSVNVFYPTVQHHCFETILADLYNHAEPVTTGHHHDVFCLILAIGSQMTKHPELRPPLGPDIYFQKATRHLQRSRHSWSSREQLRAFQKSLLTCIYLLSSPSSGDIWRNLGFAIRLFLDLSHRPAENDDIDDELLCMLTRTLYSLEWYDVPSLPRIASSFAYDRKANEPSQVSIAFGRPSLLNIGDNFRDVSRLLSLLWGSS